MNTHKVKCYVCDKKLAFWSGLGDNHQYADEYVCNNRSIRRKTPKGCKVIKTLKSGKEKELKYELCHCEVSNDSVYCFTCAKKLKFKCNNCKKGKIILSRKR